MEGHKQGGTEGRRKEGMGAGRRRSRDGGKEGSREAGRGTTQRRERGS